MSVEINEKLVDQIASQIKTQDDLADFSRLLINNVTGFCFLVFHQPIFRFNFLGFYSNKIISRCGLLVDTNITFRDFGTVFYFMRF
ncbi:hypothetical protein [Endozoicomonas atrinae]|uniref:hypothetical protein n=1 Tax=Endozoicomonas atrinae TaxID=1333660 RepID=UPI0008263A4C|nr:hypothetical protein [Endozoicomonas atrinae]